MYAISPYVIWDPRQPAENPIYNSLVIKLYCRTGYHLAITSTGKVRGLPGTNETDGNFEGKLDIVYVYKVFRKTDVTNL